MFKHVVQFAYLIAFSGLCATQVDAAPQGNFMIRGTILKNACNIDSNSVSQEVDLGQTLKNSLYQNGGYSEFKTFNISLTDCDVSIADAVKFKFTGAADNNLDGGLKFSSGSARGMGVMVYYADSNKKIGLNHSSELLQQLPIKAGYNSFELKARLEAYPEAISNQTIESGDFKAIMEFTLEYI